MRGAITAQCALVPAINLDNRIPANHPIRAIKALADPLLKAVDKKLGGMYAAQGRPSIPPEHLLKATLLMALYSIRSERLEYDLLFRWFLDLFLEEAAFDHSVFSKDRRRMLFADVTEKFPSHTVLAARKRHLISEEHFTGEGALIEAWASMKSFRPKDGGPGGGMECASISPCVDRMGALRNANKPWRCSAGGGGLRTRPTTIRGLSRPYVGEASPRTWPKTVMRDTAPPSNGGPSGTPDTS